MIEDLKPLFTKFMIFAKDRFQFKNPPRLFLKRDRKNSDCMLGKTAHYDPSNFGITLYISRRHPKDILRSLAHELVHHCQNERGDLAPEKMKSMNKNYAQENDHMRKMEEEAYLQGNMCFRDWEDGLDDKLKYRMHLAEHKFLKENKKMSVKNKKLTKKFLKETITKLLDKKLLNEQGLALGVSPAKTPEERVKALESLHDFYYARQPKKYASDLWKSTKVALNKGDLKPSDGLIQDILQDLVDDKTISPRVAVGWGLDQGVIAGIKNFFAGRGVGPELPERGSYINNTEMTSSGIADTPANDEDNKVAPQQKQPPQKMQETDEKKEETESKVRTPEQQSELYESRFAKRNTKLFEKLLKEWAK